MAYSILTLNNFKNAFKGNYSVKGRTITKEKSAKGKLEADSFLDKTAITTNDIEDHLQGIKGIGMSPIDEKGFVSFGVIDIDDYSVRTDLYLQMIFNFNLPLVPFYSKSKGIHAYIFFSEPVNPSDAVDLLTIIRMLLGLPKNTEIFPKQRAADKVSYGSWINLPYFDASNPDNPRKLVKEDSSLASLEEALMICVNSQKTLKEYYTLLAALPLSDAPPCLQTVYMQQETDFRNEYLFSLGVYFKSKYPDSFEEEIKQANMMLIEPVDATELEKTVLSSMRKKEYRYRCGQPPLTLYCNKGLCRERKLGLESDSTNQLSYEEFTQYDTDPPYYEWVINGQVLRFYKEADIINQYAFRELVFRKLHYMPPKLSDARWTRIVNDAMANIEIKAVEKESDIATGGIWLKLITDFFTARVPAATKLQIKAGRTYRDNDTKQYIFSGTQLLEYLKGKNFKAYTETEIQARLKELGAKPVQYDIAPGQALRVWSMPCDKIDYMSMDTSDVEIDFYDDVEEGDKY